MNRVKIKLGDVFQVPLDDGKVGYFQYIAVDSSLLHSEVIRAFCGEYGSNEEPDIGAILSNPINFHAHILLKLGMKLGLWTKVGNAPPPSQIDVIFRGTNDYIAPKRIDVSHRWYVWRINEPFLHVGFLETQYQNSEIGVVYAAYLIPERMKSGLNTLVYPGY